MTREIQADFGAARVETARPVSGCIRLEIVPFETDAELLEAAIELFPACPNGAPRRSFFARQGRRSGRG